MLARLGNIFYWLSVLLASAILIFAIVVHLWQVKNKISADAKADSIVNAYISEWPKLSTDLEAGLNIENVSASLAERQGISYDQARFLAVDILVSRVHRALAGGATIRDVTRHMEAAGYDLQLVETVRWKATYSYPHLDYLMLGLAIAFFIFSYVFGWTMRYFLSGHTNHPVVIRRSKNKI